MPSAANVRVPFVGPLTAEALTVRVSLGRSPSVSLASTLVAPVVRNVTVPPSSTVALSGTATGASLSEVIEILTVAVAAPPLPS